MAPPEMNLEMMEGDKYKIEWVDGPQSWGAGGRCRVDSDLDEVIMNKRGSKTCDGRMGRWLALLFLCHYKYSTPIRKCFGQVK